MERKQHFNFNLSISNIMLKGHDHDFGQILFFCVYYSQCVLNA